MTKQYNVNIVGSLTNTDGVLSGFSSSNYATLPSTLYGLTINSLEIVFKFMIYTANSNGFIFWTDVFEGMWSGIRLSNYNNDNEGFDLEVTNNGAQVGYVADNNAISTNTYYYIKLLYDNVNGYSLYKSYARLFQAVEPSPILLLPVSSSKPTSPEASVGFTVLQLEAVSLRS